MKALGAIGIALVLLGVFSIFIGLALLFGIRSPDFLGIFLISGAVNSIIGGLVLIAIARITEAAEQIAVNTEPLLALAGRNREPGVVHADPADAPHDDAGVVNEAVWKGRKVREFADGRIHAETLTGWREFSDWNEFRRYIE